jgi:hypothetical protein
MGGSTPRHESFLAAASADSLLESTYKRSVGHMSHGFPWTDFRLAGSGTHEIGRVLLGRYHTRWRSPQKIAS